MIQRLLALLRAAVHPSLLASLAMRSVVSAAALAIIGSASSMGARPRAGAQQPSPSPAVARRMTMAGRSAVYAPHGVAATSQPLATEAALAVLQREGLAKSIQWAEKLIGLNASGRAGALMTREELLHRGRTQVIGRSAESITVPGALAGWQALLQRFGTITLAQAIEPAIRYAEEGFPVTPVIAADWEAAAPVLARDDGARATFLIADGDERRAPRAGQWFRNPDYARTLRAIARDGPTVLYDGISRQWDTTRRRICIFSSRRRSSRTRTSPASSATRTT